MSSRTSRPAPSYTRSDTTVGAGMSNAITVEAGLLEALYRNASEWLEAGATDKGAPRFFLERATERITSTHQQALERLSVAG